MVKKYRKKPLTVEAVQWRVDLESQEEIIKFGAKISEAALDDLILETLEGPMFVTPWSYIVKGNAGEFWAVRPEIFEETYEKVEE